MGRLIGRYSISIASAIIDVFHMMSKVDFLDGGNTDREYVVSIYAIPVDLSKKKYLPVLHEQQIDRVSY